MNLKNSNARYIGIIAVIIGIFVAYSFVLFKMQIVENEYYKEQSAKRI